MTGHDDQARESIHESIQQHVLLGEKALLTGWVLVAEWADHDGARWLTKACAAATTSWTAGGMLHDALYGTWPEEDRD